MIIEEKSKLKSRTIQYNSLWLAIASAVLVIFTENQELVKSVLPDSIYLIVIMLNSVVGIYLRMGTVEPVKPLRKPKHVDVHNSHIINPHLNAPDVDLVDDKGDL